MGDFKKMKIDAWKYYRKWQKEKTIVKCLNQEVIISRLGWNHLIWGSKKRPRNLSDSKQRLLLLKAAKHTIKYAKTSYTERRNNSIYIILEGLYLLANKQKEIRVVLKKDKRERLTFFSVMSK